MFLNKGADIFFPSEITLPSTSFQRQVVHCQHDNLEHKSNKGWEKSIIRDANLPREMVIVLYLCRNGWGTEGGKERIIPWNSLSREFYFLFCFQH